MICGLDDMIYLRGLNDVTQNTYLEVEDCLKWMYEISGIQEADYKALTTTGLPDAIPWDAGNEPMSIAEAQERYSIYAQMGWISQGTGYTWPMKKFSRHKKMTELAYQLGDTVGRYKQRAGVGLYLGGMDEKWNAQEGLPWFHTAHPLAPGNAIGVGATYPNLIYGSPSILTYQNASTMLCGTPDDLGTVWNFRPEILMVTLNRFPVWESLIGTNKGRTDSASPAEKNIFFSAKYGCKLVANPWIPAEFDNMAFLIGNKKKTQWNNVVTLETDMEFVKKSKDTLHYADACFGYWINDWRNVVCIYG
jgi:hypothetical protein